ncbi:ABC transporter permease [Sansalvadorimonas sp. 2012CJ34-2]|uniref:ABC transporter permease n=1 Tax=Parendozoicomonas callyspongiae TaxID=2942213 RepID=A0ABT0PGK3_9GAMM|nr:ABC transporter permease [Sansalvadorimonas sp. 2012CJ34-2]MCL6270507.1 ABC transporter permease [Sansalvadorimonas sp. 2012CJ34-2]
MLSYILKRCAAAIPLLAVLSFISFTLIQLPPGDYGDQIKNYAITLSGMSEADAEILAQDYRVRHGLDKPFHTQYLNWMKGILTEGDFGFSFNSNKPISELVADRLPMTLFIALLCHLGATLFGAALGIVAARKQYTWIDNLTTLFAFIGMTTPRFVLSLIMLYWLVFIVGSSHVAALFSPEFALAPWSFAKFVNLMQHIWPVLLVAIYGGMAQNLRVMRSNVLDVMQAQYVETAKAKGLSSRRVLFKHIVPNALHPLIMYQGVALPYMIAGELEVAIVFSLPTVGPLIVESMAIQDIYVVSTFMMLLAATLVIGNLLADLLLAALDPRIRLA